MTDAPAASFILLSYCQEDTIAGAVQSLLDQECEPIEIIISDDASTDNTFAKAQQVAENYSGPHKLILRRNETNLGVNQHIELAISIASSELMIWTAGDDINTPNRAQRIIDCHRETGAKLLFSDAESIGPDGRAGESRYRRALFYRDYSTIDAATSFALYLGATVAWDKELYRKYGGFPKKHAYEDLILGFRALLEDSLHYIPEELVIYREGVGISAEPDKAAGSRARNEFRIQNLLKELAVLKQRQADARTFGYAKSSPLCKTLDRKASKTYGRLVFHTGRTAVSGSGPYSKWSKLNGFLSEAIRVLRRK